MAEEAACEPIVEDIVDLFACMVVLIAGCCIEMMFLTSSGSSVVSLILEAAGRPAA